MSGIFGIIDPNRKVEASSIISRMKKVMSHRSWYVTECVTDENANLGIGRIGIGIFNALPQPTISASGDFVLFIAGEIYNLKELGKASPELTDEAFILGLYEAYGSDLFKLLNGSFAVAIWDKREHQVLVATDRFSTYPIYYYYKSGRFLFSPEVKGILCDPFVEVQLDIVALAQYMRFQHLLGVRTFLEAIQQLPKATVLVYDLEEKRISLHRYWDYSEIPCLPNIKFEEAVEETGKIFRTAVEKLTQGPLRPGVYLSGGLDSRSILGMVDRRPIVSINYGDKNCRDTYYSKRIASTVGSEHHWFNFPDGTWVKEFANFHLELTEGFHSWIHMHGINTLADARKWMDVNLSGWDGGLVMGHPACIEPLLISPVDEVALLIRNFECYNQSYTWPSITEAEESYLYTNDLYKKIKGLAIDSLREELAPYIAYRKEVRCDYFGYDNHDLRLTLYMIVFMRSHLDVRFPFLDYDLFDFLYSLPIEHRADRKLYFAMIQKEMAKLARIPYDHDEFLPTSNRHLRNSHAIVIKAKRRFNQWVYPLFQEWCPLYADYENYLRTDLKEWAEEILFRPEVGERNIFNVDFIRSIFARHISGRELWTIGKIAPIITYEMMLRRLYGGASSE
jgi:asparagine synthase (glutamine-hydrolysing)